MQFAFTRSVFVGVYLVFVAWLGAVCANLAHHVGGQAMAFAQTYVPQERPTKLSRVARAELAELEAKARGVRAPHVLNPSVADTEPELAAPKLAVQLDMAEKVDLGAASPQGRRVARAARPVSVASGRGGKSAGEIFGQSFGVMLASR